MTPRPTKQDIKPKAFHLPPIMMALEYEPTDRYVLWLIAHYPYLCNPYFLGDIVGKNETQAQQDSKLGKLLATIRHLRVKGLIRQSKDLMTWHLTRKGQWHRLTTHPQWPLIQVGTPATIGIIAICLTIYFNTRKDKNETPPSTSKETKHPMSDSATEPEHPSPKDEVKKQFN